jgi:outer membrane biosynthesis protein TonB
MISFTSILTAIKSASLAAKVGLSVGAVAVVAGGAAGTVTIINANKAHEETQIVANSPNDDSSPSEQEDTQIGETGESKDGNNKSEQVPSDNKPTTNNSQTTAQEPNSGSASNSQSNNSPSSKPSTPTTQPSQSSQPSAPSQPSQPTQPAKKPDYNLNDRYVVGSSAYAFYTYDDTTSQCSLAEEKSFFGIAKFAGTSNDLWSGSHSGQYAAYAKSKGYDTAHCGGMGAAIMSWQDAISQGLALDEAKCAQYSLSCGRW